jgi:hypothetical protein
MNTKLIKQILEPYYKERELKKHDDNGFVRLCEKCGEKSKPGQWLCVKCNKVQEPIVKCEGCGKQARKGKNLCRKCQNKLDGITLKEANPLFPHITPSLS